MKKSAGGLLLALASLSTFAVGGPLLCPPVLSPDGQHVDPACPGLGAEIFASPDAVYSIFWNDNRNTGDYDFNDLWARIAFNHTGNHATITWTGSASGLDNAMYYGFTELFSNSSHASPVTITTIPGLEVVFGLFVPDHPAEFYFDGPAIRNADHQIHAYVTTATPEPATWAVILIGLAGIGLAKLLSRGQRQ